MPEQQCPVCGQKMDSAVPFCPQCGTAMALVMRPVSLLTNAKSLDVLVGMFIEGGLLVTVITTALQLLATFTFGWVGVFIVSLLATVGAYFLFRRTYPFVARGIAIGYILGLLLILGILWLCSGHAG